MKGERDGRREGKRERCFTELSKYLCNLACPAQLTGVSIHMLRTGIFIDSEIDQPCCIDAPLSLVSMALGVREVF